MRLSDIALTIRPSQTLSISEVANARKNEGIDVINFSAGEPDFNTPQVVKDAAIEAINDNFTRYTAYEGIKELREAFAKDLEKTDGLKYDYDQIVVSNGSKHALKNAFIAVLNPGDEVILPAPYWNSYLDIIKMTGGIPVIVKTKKEYSFKVRVEQLEEVVTPKTKAIIINSPNNPTGMVYSAEELEKIGKFAIKHDLFIISDEIYKRLIYSKKLRHTSIAGISTEIYERTIIVDGLSKSHAMTGWRVGYTASSKKIAGVIGNIQSNSTSNVNSIAQVAALTALKEGDEDVRKMLGEFERRRDYISQRVSDIPFLSCLLPKGAFYIFVDVSKLFGHSIGEFKIDSSADVAKILMDKYNVAVVSSDAFGYDNYIRISYATSMRDIVEGVNRIEKFVKDNF